MIAATGQVKRERPRNLALSCRFAMNIANAANATAASTLDTLALSLLFGQGRSDHAVLAEAGVPVVFYTDGDAQYDPREMTRLLAAFSSEVDFVNGSAGVEHRRPAPTL